MNLLTESYSLITLKACRFSLSMSWKPLIHIPKVQKKVLSKEKTHVLTVLYGAPEEGHCLFPWPELCSTFPSHSSDWTIFLCSLAQSIYHHLHNSSKLQPTHSTLKSEAIYTQHCMVKHPRKPHPKLGLNQYRIMEQTKHKHDLRLSWK
jgi:hypothetical protein